MADDDASAAVKRLEAELRQLQDLYASSRAEVASLRQENGSLREREAALAEVLRVIASSPADLQQVLDALVASAARLCGADSASVMRVEGDEVVRLATTSPERLLPDTRSPGR